MSMPALLSLDDDPQLDFPDSCPQCGHLVRVVQLGEELPPDDHAPCASTAQRNIALAHDEVRVDAERHLLLLIRQLVQDPIGPWPAAHLDADPRWELAVAWARWAGWDETDPWPDMDEEIKRAVFWPAHQAAMLHFALRQVQLPDAPSLRARLRATLEGVPQAQRPPLERSFMVSTLAYGDYQGGRWVLVGIPEQHISTVAGWPLTAQMQQAAAEVAAEHRRKLACWFGAGVAIPPGPRTGAPAKSLDYLDAALVAHYAEKLTVPYRLFDGNPQRMAHEMSKLLKEWYRVAYNRRYRAPEELDGAPVGYPGGIPAFCRVARQAVCAHLPTLPPLPGPVAQAQKRRRR
jgi:hypothetical protein